VRRRCARADLQAVRCENVGTSSWTSIVSPGATSRSADSSVAHDGTSTLCASIGHGQAPATTNARASPAAPTGTDRIRDLPRYCGEQGHGGDDGQDGEHDHRGRLLPSRGAGTCRCIIDSGEHDRSRCRDDHRERDERSSAQQGKPRQVGCEGGRGHQDNEPERLGEGGLDADLSDQARRYSIGGNRRTTRIEEMAGSHQAAGDRVWFGKTFYDDEGVTGVGAIGYFDRTANRYVLVNSAELAAWSTSALLIEDDVAWVGLVRRPEGASRSGGLLRYDLKENRSGKLLVPDIVLTITRWNGALYLGTTNGLYVIREDAMSRFRIEPGPRVEFMIISEDLSGSSVRRASPR
jgi:hypothetical protein